MKIKVIIVLALMTVCTNIAPLTVMARADTITEAPKPDEGHPQDRVQSFPLENREKQGETSFPEGGYGGKSTSPFSTYKINYFSINKWPDRESAQVKFQFSAKYKFLNRDISIEGRPFALYLAYTQKSLWNVGQTSMPFEESNYNPEAFFDYNVNLAWGKFVLRDIILSPFEHESNGMAGPESRSWNRLYAALRFGYLPLAGERDAKTIGQDHVELYVKAWHAYGYADQDAYLQSLGRNETFLDYEGYGEISLVLRDIIVQGDWGNRVDITSKVGGKQNCEIQYQQKIPRLNFSLYIQYWYGYDETLLRFDRFGKRTFAGVSFSY